MPDACSLGAAQPKRKKQPRPLYSVEYSHPEPTAQGDETSSKPMTPRRVKRRSVISRDGTRRSSRRSSSVRQSRRKNPVNRIMDHQESLYANTGLGGAAGGGSLAQGPLNYDRISWDRNPCWQPEMTTVPTGGTYSGPSVDNSANNYSNNSAGYPAALSNEHSINCSNNYSNTSSSTQNLPNWDSTRNLADTWQPELAAMQWPTMQGQSNPSFQQTSTQSLNAEDLEELYGNRPASARSSYSNYHGVRATPQVPSRGDIVRQSQRQFVLSGPPAYQDTVI